ncbi:hypothetical protein EGR_07498 [Echinococcus granulosus]|uniref:Uncharacterized protein n=1 Tax=Echinococcus granulosus TaxID=6210 RepID=W6UHQ0_ECHGR|nr:hypothetical protein EGR_07498 [Echinococcus granulosus]EUB57622.1 hypothetical protein EGR_07498 [Echinococcus granulosus]
MSTVDKVKKSVLGHSKNVTKYRVLSFLVIHEDGFAHLEILSLLISTFEDSIFTFSESSVSITPAIEYDTEMLNAAYGDIFRYKCKHHELSQLFKLF